MADGIKTYMRGGVLIFKSNAKETVQAAIELTGNSPVAHSALAAWITVFSTTKAIKRGGNISVFVKTPGLLNGLIFEITRDGAARALIENRNPQLDIEKAIDEKPGELGFNGGTLKLVYYAEGGENYGGEIEFTGGSAVAAFTEYFVKSEQVMTRAEAIIRFSENGNILQAEAIVLQLLPGRSAADETWFNAKNLKSMLDEELEADNGYKYLGVDDFKWQCVCSTERAAKIVSLLSNQEREEIVAEFGVIEVECNFCHRKYRLGLN